MKISPVNRFRRLGLLVVLVLIFAVSFGGTFTCKTENNSIRHTEDPPRTR